MADENEVHLEKTRKTVSFTHKQLGIGGLVVALMSVGQLKELKEFFIGDQAETIARIEMQQKESFQNLEMKQLDAIAKADRGFDKLEKLIRDADQENIVRFRRMRDQSREELNQSEARLEKRSDRIESRVTNLEVFSFKTKRGNQ